MGVTGKHRTHGQLLPVQELKQRFQILSGPAGIHQYQVVMIQPKNRNAQVSGLQDPGAASYRIPPMSLSHTQPADMR